MIETFYFIFETKLTNYPDKFKYSKSKPATIKVALHIHQG